LGRPPLLRGSRGRREPMAPRPGCTGALGP